MTAAGGCTLGAALTQAADEKYLTEAYGIVRKEGRPQDLWVKLISKSGVVCWECGGRCALSLSHSAQSRSQRSATASEAHRRSFGLEA